MKKPETPSISPAVVAVAVCATTAVIVASAQDHAVQSLSDWVYRYQTLLGSLAAIIAAYVTIVQMRASDIRQEERHRELIGLGATKDKLAIERFKHTSLRLAKYCSDAIVRFNEYDNTSSEWDRESFRRFRDSIHGALTALEALDDPSFQEVRHLAPADVAWSRHGVRLALESVIELTVKNAGLRTLDFNFEITRSWYLQGAGEALRIAETSLRRFSDACESWSKSFEEPA